MHWQPVYDITDDFEIEARALYRHAHATGLFGRRNVNVRFALGHIIESANNVLPTGDAIVRAVRAYACVARDGKLVEPPTHVFVSSGSKSPSARAIAAACSERSERAATPAKFPASSVQRSELSDNAAE